MARTKHGKWKAVKRHNREEEETARPKTRCRSLKLTPATETTVPDLHGEVDSDDDDDESMDLDSEDGVSFTLRSPLDICTGYTIHEPPESEMAHLYLQNPARVLNSTRNLWQKPPHNSLSRTDSKSKAPHLRVPLLFNHSCQLITRHWGCGFENCVPVELRERTPYSLALLLVLRKVASLTKRNIEFAHQAIMDAWRDRIDDSQPPNPESPYQFVETYPQIPADKADVCESSIQENVWGLMFNDVVQALNVVMQERKIARKAKRKEIEGTAVERKVKKSRVGKPVQMPRRERKPKDGSVRHSSNNSHPLHSFGALNDTVSAPPNSPIFETSNKFNALSEQFTLSTGTQSQHTKLSNLPHATATREHSQRDKENYACMARLMVNMGVKHSKPSGKHRLDNLAAGGQSRRGRRAGVSMPSEKMDLANISALPNAGTNRNGVLEAAADMDELSLSDIPD